MKTQKIVLKKVTFFLEDEDDNTLKLNVYLPLETRLIEVIDKYMYRINVISDRDLIFSGYRDYNGNDEDYIEISFNVYNTFYSPCQCWVKIGNSVINIYEDFLSSLIFSKILK